jgi:hypothetical protein
MKKSTFKKIFGQGIALAIPLGVIAYVFVKIIVLFEKLVSPITQKLGIQRILGSLTLLIVAILLLLVLMFILGMLMQLSFVSGYGKTIESTVAKFVPSLNNVQSMVAEKLNLQNATAGWKPVLLLHENKYQPAFVIEELDDLITIFIMKGVSLDDGEILITSKSEVVTTDITANQIHIFSKQYGKGYLALIQKTNLQKA